MMTMEHPRKRTGEATVSIGRELVAQLDAYAREMARREPGIRVSRSAAARQLLCRALAGSEG